MVRQLARCNRYHYVLRCSNNEELKGKYKIKSNLWFSIPVRAS